MQRPKRSEKCTLYRLYETALFIMKTARPGCSLQFRRMPLFFPERALCGGAQGTRAAGTPRPHALSHVRPCAPALGGLCQAAPLPPVPLSLLSLLSLSLTPATVVRSQNQMLKLRPLNTSRRVPSGAARQPVLAHLAHCRTAPPGPVCPCSCSSHPLAPTTHLLGSR